MAAGEIRREKIRGSDPERFGKRLYKVHAHGNFTGNHALYLAQRRIRVLRECLIPCGVMRQARVPLIPQSAHVLSQDADHEARCLVLFGTSPHGQRA